jgi:rhamnose transport system permease protein
MKRLLQMPELFTALLLVVALVIGASTSSAFLDANYLLSSRAGDLLPTALLAVAMTFVIVGGHIDLSVGSGAVLVMVVCALLYRDAGVPMGAIVVLAPLVGAMLGLFNGLLVTRLKLPSLVVTLGTLALFRGVAMVLIGEESISRFPAWFSGIDYREVAGLQALPMLAFIVFAIGAGCVLRFTTLGRKVYAVGTNEAAARFSGIRTERVTLGLFVFSGVAMGLAALLKMSIITSASYKHFLGGELTAITAVVLGGTSIAGGRGGMLGTVLAVLLLLAVSTVLGINRVSAQNELAIVGALLIGSVIVNDRLARLLGGRRN